MNTIAIVSGDQIILASFHSNRGKMAELRCQT